MLQASMLYMEWFNNMFTIFRVLFGLLVGLLQKLVPIRDAPRQMSDVHEIERVLFECPLHLCVINLKLYVWWYPVVLTI